MELVPGLRYEVTVTNIIKSGAIVTLEDRTTELVHISNISEEYVNNPSDYLSVGETLVAIAQKGKVKAVELSFKNLKLHNRSSVEDSGKLKGGLVDPSLGFSSGVTHIVEDKSSSTAASNELDKMIKKSNEDFKSKDYFNKKKSKKKGKKKRK